MAVVDVDQVDVVRGGDEDVVESGPVGLADIVVSGITVDVEQRGGCPVDLLKEPALAGRPGVAGSPAESDLEVQIASCTFDLAGRAPPDEADGAELQKVSVDVEVDGADIQKMSVDVEAVCLIDSDAESSSSSSSSSRSRSRGRGQKRLGAAAAAALVTAAEPLDVDECERVMERQVTFRTDLAMQLQHDGRLVAIMAETGANVSVAPQSEMKECVVHVSGSATAVGRAVWCIEQARERFAKEEKVREKADAFMESMSTLEEFEIPAQHLNAVIGNNGCQLLEIRALCGEIMLAVRPPLEAGGAFTACVGPGDALQVRRGVEELRWRLCAAQGSSRAAAPPPDTSVADVSMKAAGAARAEAAPSDAPAEAELQFL